MAAATAFNMAAATAFVLLLLAAPSAHAADYVVGGSPGWDTGVNYNTWTSGKTFQVGDRLIFTYTANHKVDEVTKSDYDSCSSANTLASHDDGNTTITLSKEGAHYFLCPTFGHCGQGMKLSVTVSAAGGSPATPTTPGTPSTPGGSASTPSTPNSPNSRTPSSTPSGASSLTAIGACLLWAPILALVS